MKIGEMRITVGKPTGTGEFVWAEVQLEITQEGNSLAPLLLVTVPVPQDGSLPMSEVHEIARSQALTILKGAVADLEASSLQDLQSRRLS